MFRGKMFGLTNSVITILALVTGLNATKVNKIGIIGAMLAMLIADPLADAYSIYIAEKQTDSTHAFKTAKESLITQLLLQITFLAIIILTPDIEKAILYTYIFGIGVTIFYGKYKKIVNIEIFKNLGWILILVYLTYICDVWVFNNKKILNL